MSAEIVLFDLEGILITDRRFSAGGRSFALRSIARARMVERSRLRWPMGGLAAALVGCGYFAQTGAHPRLATALAALFAFAAALLFCLSPRYAIVVETEDGRFTPVAGRDRFLLEGAAKTLQLAIERQGAPAGATVSESVAEGPDHPPFAARPVRKSV